jgi:hypothetical protein
MHNIFLHPSMNLLHAGGTAAAAAPNEYSTLTRIIPSSVTWHALVNAFEQAKPSGFT